MLKKHRGSIVFLTVSLLIGFVLAVQINQSSSLRGGLVSLAKIKPYEDELNKLKTKKEKDIKELTELENQLNDIVKSKSEEDIIIKNLYSDLERYKMEAGFYDVCGQGIIITIKDPSVTDELVTDEYMDEESNISYHYEFLIDIVNKLKAAGAEAISINEHRIVAMTEVSFIERAVMINGIETFAPYKIKVIGNSNTLESRLTISRGIIEDMKKEGLIVNIEKKEYIVIGRYNSSLKYKFVKPSD
ncbi:DUF881 domain-containing protein [Anaerovorax odorimutans]|uniref:DUF881 domain-containing protein n=1 Tax=Anaerovorax odorimutans TaxID=109327 RepID=UPI00040ED0A7|nr:DUF881 domain-containing protein [Anaerovorax odorimutans]